MTTRKIKVRITETFVKVFELEVPKDYDYQAVYEKAEELANNDVFDATQDSDEFSREVELCE